MRNDIHSLSTCYAPVSRIYLQAHTEILKGFCHTSVPVQVCTSQPLSSFIQIRRATMAQEYSDNYGQQYSNQGFYESGLTIEDQQAPVYSEQQYNTHSAQGSDPYYSPSQQAQVYDPAMYSSQQGSYISQGLLLGRSLFMVRDASL